MAQEPKRTLFKGTKWYVWVIAVVILVVGFQICSGYFKAAEESSRTGSTEQHPG